MRTAEEILKSKYDEYRTKHPSMNWAEWNEDLVSVAICTEAMDDYASEQTKMLKDMIVRLNEQVEILLDPNTDADNKMAIAMTRDLGKVLWEKFLSESK